MGQPDGSPGNTPIVHLCPRWFRPPALLTENGLPVLPQSSSHTLSFCMLAQACYLEVARFLERKSIGKVLLLPMFYWTKQNAEDCREITGKDSSKNRLYLGIEGAKKSPFKGLGHRKSVQVPRGTFLLSINHTTLVHLSFTTNLWYNSTVLIWWLIWVNCRASMGTRGLQTQQPTGGQWGYSVCTQNSQGREDGGARILWCLI